MNLSNVITNPINNIPKNEKSHVLGWALVWKELLGASIDHKCTPQIISADVVYVEHGANFGGTLNLFGGATKEIFDRINILMACKNIVSLDWDMPDYGAMLKKRIGAKTTCKDITESWCDMVSQRISNITSLKHKDLETSGLTLGDSHSISFSSTGDRVYRTDGQTLFGALRKGFDTNLGSFGRLTLSHGSIDIRHHLLRHDSSNLRETIREYVTKGNELGDDVWYAAPVPVEFEGRRIPKSGFYKKTPFYGSWKERWDLTNKFIAILYDETKGKLVMPPKEWYTMDPEKYAKTYMEHGSSFHIAPPFYKRNDWGVTSLGTQ